MKKKIKIIIVLLIILVLVISAYFVLNKYIFADINQIKNPKAREAYNYLIDLKAKITPDYWKGIVESGNEFGFEGKILANLSGESSSSDYESFSQIRNTLYSYISDLSGSGPVNIKSNDSNKDIKSKVSSEETSVSLPNDFLPAFGCENSSVSSCLDFGSSKEIQNGSSFNPSSLNSPRNEAGITYRSVKVKEALTITLPAFNIDNNGTPKSNMLLEIRYKDTIPYDKDNKKFENDERALVKTKLDYISKDISLYGYVEKNIKASTCPKNQKSNNGPDECYPTDKLDYAVAYLGEKGDNSWKYLQVPFLKSENRHLPLLKGKDGKFTFYITMPKQIYINNDLPIDYINLRIISEKEYQDLDAIQRQKRGQKEVTYSDTNDANIQANAAENMVIYSRDIMRPVYDKTKPSQNEIKKELNYYSSLGEIETGNFAIYAMSPVSNLSFKPKVLVKAGSNDKIEASGIKIYQVINSRRTISDEKFKTYAQTPEMLDLFDSANLSANSSKRFVFEINIPDNISRGKYSGEIGIIKDGQEIDKISINLHLLGIKLENPAINFTWGDPTNTTFNQNLDELYNFYKNYGLGYLIKINSNDFKINQDDQSKVYDIDLGQFKERLLDLKKRGILLKEQPLDISTFTRELYQKVYPGANYGDRNLYQKLNQDQFKQAFYLFLDRSKNLSGELNIKFIYLAADEPASDQERIIADRIYSFIKEKNGESMVTLVPGSTSDFDKNRLGDYVVPNSKIPLKSLAKLNIDYKIWNLALVDKALDEGYPNHFSYYTTRTSYLPTAINNRFLHGFYAYRSGANLIYNYAVAGWKNDPYRDFDAQVAFDRLDYKADNILAYPAWDGKLRPTIAAIGMREGIKDLKYIATLMKLIEQNKNKTTIGGWQPAATSPSSSPKTSGGWQPAATSPSSSPKTSGGWQGAQ